MIKRNEMEKYLNSFSWSYREIFIEKSKSVKISILNWKVKTPSVSSVSGFSILSRNGKDEYFKSISGEDYDIKTEIQSFVKENSLSPDIKKVELMWDDLLSLEWVELEKTVKTVVSYCEKAYEKIIKGREDIRSSQIFINFTNRWFVVWNTAANFAKDEVFYNTVFVLLVWAKGGQNEEVFEKITWVDILSEFTEESIEKLITWSVDQLEKQFKADKAPNWEMDVIIWNEAGWTIIHEAVGHGLEWDLQWSSAYSWRLWEKVASDNVTIIDDPTIKWERWFYSFDHEWNPAKKAVLIENWVLKTYLHTEKTANKFAVESTGHARRESYACRNLVRMWTTYLAPWKDKKEDLIAKVKDWIYVSRMGGWQVDTITWNFVFDVKYGYKIKDWKLLWEIKWATISWNGPEMLNKIYGICDDLDFFDGGTCGKWQAMPVSDANPTFLTRLKVTWV